MLLLIIISLYIHIFRCDTQYIARQIGSKVALNKKVVGVIASDVTSGAQSSIGPATSFFIPTIGYIYSEDVFLDKVPKIIVHSN